jgi:hypothetical protein
MTRELKRYRVWFDDGSAIPYDALDENRALLRAQVLTPPDENRKPVRAECLTAEATTQKVLGGDHPARPTAGESVAGMLVGFCYYVILACFSLLMLIFLYKGYVWISTGEWPALSMFPVWKAILPETFCKWLFADTWIGLKRIIISILELHATDVVLFLAFASGATLTVIALLEKPSEWLDRP